MDSISLALRARRLLTPLHSMAGDPTAKTLFRALSAPALQDFCPGACAAQPFPEPEEGIQFNEAFDPAGEGFSRSMQMHQLARHVRRTSGAAQEISSGCDRRLAAMRWNCDVQNINLEEVHDLRRVQVDALRVQCDD